MDSSAVGEGLQRNYVLVLKIGTSTLMSSNEGNAAFSLSNIGRFVDTVCLLKRLGHQVVLISSGAVGAGVVAMHLREKPKTTLEKQAIAAVGQCRLMRLYEDLFSVREERVAQLLITRTDFVDKAKYINFRNAILELLRCGVIPIINENDAVASERFRFGDNDTFASHCAVSTAAHWLFILSDVDCLYTTNPRIHTDAKPIPYVDRLATVDKMLDKADNNGTAWGSGGMSSKIAAAKIATTLGIHAAIINGEHPERIMSILSYTEKNYVNNCEGTGGEGEEKPFSTFSSFSNGSNENTDIHHPCIPSSSSHCPLLPAFVNRGSACPRPAPPFGKNVLSTDTPSCANKSLYAVDNLAAMPYLGTIFVANETKYCVESMRDHRRWIFSLPVRGKIWLDIPAVRTVLVGRKPLLASGVEDVVGDFSKDEAVSIHLHGAFVGEETDEIARCIVNINSNQLNKIRRIKTKSYYKTKTKRMHAEEIKREESAGEEVCNSQNSGGGEGEEELKKEGEGKTIKIISNGAGGRKSKGAERGTVEVASRPNIIFIRPSLHDGIYRDIFLEKILKEEKKNTTKSALVIHDDEEEEEEDSEDEIGDLYETM